LGLRPGWPYARIAGGPGLPERVVHRLLCAGRIRTLLCDQSGSPLDLGRTHRVVSDKLFRALLLRDCGCSHPGCGSRHGLEAHHVRHWLHGGRTDLRNLVLLCRRHHHAHHDGEFLITATGDGRFRYHRADGRELPERIDPTQVADPATNISNVEDEHADVHNDAAMTRWDGQPLDRHYAIATLAPDLYSSKQMSA
jgi:hypothetical protein